MENAKDTLWPAKVKGNDLPCKMLIGIVICNQCLNSAEAQKFSILNGEVLELLTIGRLFTGARDYERYRAVTRRRPFQGGEGGIIHKVKINVIE